MFAVTAIVAVSMSFVSGYTKALIWAPQFLHSHTCVFWQARTTKKTQISFDLFV